MVIGSGSGLEVSFEVAERGFSAAVVEEGLFGGTCLNRGCIPSKTLINCADVMKTAQWAEAFGIKARVEAVDWKFIVQRASEEVDADARSIEEGNRQIANILVVKGRRKFAGQKNLEDTIDAVFTREDVERPKPDPEIYLLAAQKFGVAP